MKTRYLYLIYFIMSIIDIVILNLALITLNYFFNYNLNNDASLLIVTNYLWITAGVFLGLYNGKMGHKIDNLYRLSIKSFIFFSFSFTIYIVFSHYKLSINGLLFFYGLLFSGLLLSRFAGIKFEKTLKKHFKNARSLAVIGRNSMKIAIVHDELIRKGGAEQVALSFKRAFPDAPFYTLTYDAPNTYPEFLNTGVKTSWFGKLIKSEKNMKRFYFPLGILAMKQLDLSEFDVVLQSTTHCAKFVKTNDNALVITYCHNPFRLVWSPDSYEKVKNAGLLKKFLYQNVISVLKNIDFKAA